MMPTDSQGFISEWKGKPIDGIYLLDLVNHVDFLAKINS